MTSTIGGRRLSAEPGHPTSVRAIPGVTRVLASVVLVWLLWGACTAVLFFTIDATAWSDTSLPTWSRVGLLARELFMLVYVSLALALTAELVRPRDNPRPAARAVLRSSWRYAVVLAVGWLAAFAYAASWLTFRSTGHFLDLATLRLWWSNAVQVFQHASHMEPLALIQASVGSLVFAVVLTTILANRDRILRGRSPLVVSVLGGVLLTVSIALPVATRWGVVGGVYDSRRTEATGPLTHLVADIQFRLSGYADESYRNVEPIVTREAIIPLGEYEARVSGPRDRYNVLLIVIESLRPDQLRAFGGKRSVMPTVDAIADSGRVFARHYTQASHSDYADPTLLSSHYPLRSTTYHIYPEQPAYPRVLTYDLLSAFGYRVGIFSSQNEAWSGMINYLETGNIDRFLHSETYDGPTYVPERDRGFAAWATTGRRSGKIDDRFTVNEAIEWIEQDDRPFFIYMNLQNSHVPYVIPADFDPPFGSGRVSFPIRFGYFPRDSIQAVKDLYASSLAYIDSQLARLVDLLKSTGRWNETVIVVTGDTGQAFYEHGFTSHGSALYDEVMRVPLIVRAPGLDAGRDSGLSQHVDVPPTTLGLLGLPPHPSFQGRDLLAEGDDDERSLYLLGQALVHQYAIVRGSWKLIYDLRTGTYELYDVLADPRERANLVDAEPAVVERLALDLHAWRKAQIEYYSDPLTYGSWYPPRMRGARTEH